jgi:hypothetical protein
MGSTGEATIPTRLPITATHISNLRALLSNTDATLLVPGDAGFAATLHRWSGAAEKPAGATVVPTSAASISETLRYATMQQLDVAVCGGGHSTAGASSTDGGLLISLSQMRGVAVDVERQLLRVQGGATWADVDAEAYKHGLATVGGTVSDTGVGGLTLGGGYGWLSGQYGLVIDNLVSATMVLANGEVVTCSEAENQELFWAVRGAGQNFGVAVEFVYKAYGQGECYAGMVMFPAVEEVVKKVVEVTNQLYTPREQGGKYGATVLGGKGAGGLGFARPPPAGGQVILLAPIIYQGSEEEAKEAYKELFALGPIMSTCAMVPYTVANQVLNPPPNPTMRSSMKGASFTWPLRPEFVWETLKSFEEFTDRVADAKGSMLLYEAYDPAKTVQAAGNADMGFCNRGWQANACIAPIWDGQANDQVSRQWARQAAEMFKEELKRGGQVPGKGVGGVGAKGGDGAVMLYGNYDRERPFAWRWVQSG